MQHNHIVSSYDDELLKVETLILSMGSTAEQMLEKAVISLCTADNALAKEVIKEEVRKEIRVEVNSDDQGQMEAVIKTTTTENGETVVDEKVISGTEEEIQAAVEEMKDVKISINKEEE